MDMTEAETEEKFFAKDYVRIMTEAQTTRAEDTKALNEKEKAKAAADTKLLADKELLEATKDEHHNLQLYLAQLHGNAISSCAILRSGTKGVLMKKWDLKMLRLSLLMRSLLTIVRLNSNSMMRRPHKTWTSTSQEQ